MSAKSKKGLQVFRELLGEEAAAQYAESLGSNRFCSAAGELTLEYVFADIWGRPGLERKQRSLVTLGMLMATRQTKELKNHIRIGLNNGLTTEEIEEVILQAIPYLGLPAFATASTATIEVLREMGLLDDSIKTPEERGLL